MPLALQGFFKQILKFFVPTSMVLYAVSCATIVSPTGGPKDITAPKMLGSQPRNLSTNFKGEKIIINFDEYVQLKTPEKFLLISPPMGKMPDIKVKGRSVVIKLEDSLRSNTTYNFYFGDAIVDNTEANPLTNFNFAFSTGPEIDSLSMTGNVTDAFTRMPVKAALVMLYNDFTDSVPMKQIPMYVSRTLENGSFRLNSLASGKYRAIALVDGNSDYMYNLPTEFIGFNSDSVMPFYNAASQNDTNAIKLLEADRKNFVSIDIFPEPDSTQRVLKSTIAAKNRLSVVFRYSMANPTFRPLNVPDSLPWSILEWNRTNDTLQAWLLNKPDTLNLEISDNSVVLDTITISTTMKTAAKGRKTNASESLKYATSLSGGFLRYDSPLMVSFSNPIKQFDLTALKLICKTEKDTTTITPTAFFADSIHRKLMVTHKWDSKNGYDLYIPESAFIDIYSDSCDSTHVVFQMRDIEEYGKFAVTVSLKGKNCPVIIQLITEKGMVVDQQITSIDRKIDFGLLPPAKYGLKAIIDSNGNGRWDTGEFIKKIQPEKVLVHPKLFEVRTNWELEETWDL
ncbi:MAG: Ig-like domain-containing protein [Bacteroidales bacterium]